MFLDRAFRFAFRHFTTLFLIAASVVVPLHLAYSFAHHEVVAVADLHDDIAAFPDDRRVRGVGRAELEGYRLTGTLVALVELALVPVLVAAAGNVAADDAAGRVPFVGRALAEGATGWMRLRIRRVGPVLAGAIVALFLALLARAAGGLAAEPVPGGAAWAAAGLVEGAARAIGAPFLLAPAALAWTSAKVPHPSAPTS